MNLRPQTQSNFFKELTWRNAEYRQFVETFACTVCDRPAVVDGEQSTIGHHWGGSRGTAIKCADAFLSPLCNDCHCHWHQHRCFAGKSKEESENIQIRAQRDCLAKWIMSTVPNDDE